jgi:hypothetical protein
VKIAFTICSNNYLAHAKTLGDSMVAHNSDYKFFICLVDELSPDIDYTVFEPYTIVQAKDIGITDFDSLWKKYNIVELNTCVKASFFKYLFREYNHASFAFYLDPDIMIFHSLDGLEQEFDKADVLLTPHILSAIPLDGMLPNENIFLNYGVYNLGFLGVKNNSKNVTDLLNWWEERLLTVGHTDIANGVFVDQLWMNFAPIYFDKVKVLKSQGYNAAPWNLHERFNMRGQNGSYIMHDNSQLVFYHFSNNLSGAHYRYSAFNTPIIKLLNDSYRAKLEQNNVINFKKIPCYYVLERQKYVAYAQKNIPLKNKVKYSIASFAKQILPPFLLRVITSIK